MFRGFTKKRRDRSVGVRAAAVAQRDDALQRLRQQLEAAEAKGAADGLRAADRAALHQRTAMAVERRDLLVACRPSPLFLRSPEPLPR